MFESDEYICFLNIITAICIYISVLFVFCFILSFLISTQNFNNCNDCRFFINDKCVSSVEFDKTVELLNKEDGMNIKSSIHLQKGSIYVKREH